MRYRYLLAALLSLAATSASARQLQGLEGDYLVPYVGYADVLNQDEHPGTAQFGVEYRFADVFYGLRPTVGVNVDSKWALYGYGGINWDIELISHKLFLIPNFMVGLYHDGDGADLGGPIEFRSGLELAYQFENQHRVGIAFNHTSNASIYDKNPGSETLLINWAIPVSSIR